MQRLQIVLKLGGVPKSLCLCSGLESPLVLPLPEPFPIESGLGLRPVELAPQGTATPGGVTICFIWTIRRGRRKILSSIWFSSLGSKPLILRKEEIPPIRVGLSLVQN